MNLSNQYNELLLLAKWEERRDEILKRDNFKCSRCKIPQYENGIYTQLNVHHRKYVAGKLPWQYPDEDLITLCKSCHKDEHSFKVLSTNMEIIHLDWKRINSHLFDNVICPKSYEVKVNGKIINGSYEFLNKSYSNYFYCIWMRDQWYSNIANGKEHEVLWIGKKMNCFQKETPYTFFKIYNSILENQYQKDRESDTEVSIKIGINQIPFTFSLIRGLWINIKTGFYFYLADNKDNILISTKRVVNDYVKEPAKKDYIELFVEEHHLKDLDFIVEQKIIQKIPFFIEQSYPST